MPFDSRVIEGKGPEEKQQRIPRSTQVMQTSAQPLVSPREKDPYQRNLSVPVQQKQREWNTRSVLGEIYKTAQNDPQKAMEQLAQFQVFQSDPNSKFYNPYAQATNRSVGNLSAYGIDTSRIDDDFFKNNNYLSQYLIYDGTTNTPTKPGKKATAEQKAAYEYYQILKSEDLTKKAEREWAALQQEMKYWAGRDDLNLSDDQIIDRIDWSKYSTLSKMDADKANYQPTELNRAIGYSRDALYGVLWNARNNNADGDVTMGMAMSGLGEGNAWQENPEIAAKLDWNNKDTYAPYSVGMTANDVGLYYNKNRLTQADVDEIRRTTDPNDKTAVSMASKAQQAVDNWTEAQKELDALNAQVDKWIKGNLSPDRILKKLDEYLGKSEYSMLAKMDKSIEEGSEVIPMADKVDYRKQDIIQRIQDGVAARSTNGGTNYAEKTEEDAGVPEVQTATEQEKAVEEADNQKLTDAADAIDEDAEPSESWVIRNAWKVSSAVGTIRQSIARIKEVGLQVQSLLTEDTKKDCISNLSSALLTDADIVQNFDRYTESLEGWRKERDEAYAAIGDLVHAGERYEDDTIVPVTINGTTYDLHLIYDYDKEKYEDEGIFEQDSGLMRPGRGAFTQDEYDTAVNEAISNETEKRAAVEKYGNAEVTEEQQELINKYKDAENAIEEAEEYIRKNQDAYDTAVWRTQQAEARYNATIKMMKAAGIDTTDMERAYDVSNALLSFAQYEPTEWREYSIYDGLSTLISESGDYEQALKLADANGDQLRENIELADWLLDYCERNGINLPDNIKENVLRWKDKLERECYEFDNMKLMTKDDFKDKVAEGRAAVQALRDLEYGEIYTLDDVKKLPIWNMLNDQQKRVVESNDENFGFGPAMDALKLGILSDVDIEGKSLDILNMYGLEDLLKDYEKDTFYYLLATEGFDKANEYYESLVDSSYGVLNARAATLTREKADTLAGSGLGGRIAANALSMLLSPVAAIGSLAYMAERGIKKLAGERVEFNPNNINLSANIYKKEARAKIQQEIIDTYGEGTLLQQVMSTLNEIITNRGDSFINMIAFGPLFAGINGDFLNEFMSALPMAFTAATDAVAEAKDKGASDTQLLGIFLATMIAEAGTETISIGNMKAAAELGSVGGMKAFLKNWLTNSGISEMIGESINDIIENTADEIFMGDQSEYQMLVYKYITADHMSKKDAELAARRDQMMGVLHTALVSYLSPGLDMVSYGASRFNYLRARTKYEQQRGNPYSIFDVMRLDKQEREAAAAMQGRANTPTGAPAEQTETAAPAAEGQTQNVIAPDETTGPVEQRNNEAPVQGDIEVIGAPEEESSVAMPEQSPEQQATLAYQLLDSAKDADAATQTDTIASVLDEGGTDESGDMARAAANRIDLLTGGDMSGIDLMQDLVVSASDSGADLSLVKQAVQNAILGGENSAAWQLMQSNEYMQADLSEKARMLVKTVDADERNADVQNEIAKAVHENRVAEAERDLIVSGQVDQQMTAIKDEQKKADKAQEDADTATKNREQATKDLQTQQDVEQAKADAVKRASEELQNNPSHENADMLNHALTEQNNQSKVTEEMEQHLAKAQEDEAKAFQVRDAAQKEADSVKQENMKQIRQMAEERVAQQDQERAAAREQQAAEQQQAEAAQKEAERQQKVADHRSGKLQEESDRAKLLRLAEQRGYTGEQAEQFVQDVLDFASNKRFSKLDKSKPLSAAEGYLVMGALSRRFGVNVNITETEGNVNGYYDPATNTVTLNKNLPAGQILVEFALHEVTHSLEQTGKYKKYHDTVLDILYPTKAERDAAVAKMMAEREDAGHPLADEAAAEREIVAEFTRLRLADRNVVARMVDAGLGGQMRNTLHNINQFLKNKLKGNKNQAQTVDNEGKSIGQKQLTAEDLRRAERMFQKAIQERSRKVEKARREAIKKANTPQAKMERAAKPVVTNRNGTADISEVGNGTYTKSDTDYEYSTRSWTDEEKARVKGDLTQKLVADGMSQEEAEQKAQKYVDDVTSVASIVLADPTRLDYEADPTKRMLKPNNEYYFTVDASTLCAKRLLYQGTFNAIQKLLPNTPLMPSDLIELANLMRDMGFETPCGICYVESRRRWLGKFANEWLTEYNGEYIPTIQELTTSDGLEQLRKNHPEAYESFVAEMNSKGSANPKVVQLRTDYRGDIMEMTEGEVQKVKDIGGLRIQSFSDFEVPHLIDMMQAVADMASRGLTAQAYTKVPAFAWAFGDTGIKINLSEIGKGAGIEIDDGISFAELAAMPYEEAKKKIHLLYDDVEGMPHGEAIAIRNRYSKNVGTILVGINDEHIIAAMADGEVDFIIPFHKSGWSEEELRGMPVLDSYSDYTDSQNERLLRGTEKKYKKKGYKKRSGVDGWIARNGEQYSDYQVVETENGFEIRYDYKYDTESFKSHKERTGESNENLQPVGKNGYWDFSKSGRENAETYLRLCAEMGRVPKFAQFLVDNGDGSYSLPQGDDFRSTAIREGYWKTLIDFKMYDNDGNGAEQGAVTTNVNMDEARRVLDEYSLSRKMPGGQTVTRQNNNELPVAQEVVDAFVDQYKANHPGREYSAGGELSEAQKAQAFQETAQDYQSAVERGDMQAAQEDVDTYAEQRGYTEDAYHGTNSFGFTEFDMSASQDMIFVAYKSDVAGTYARSPRVRSVSDTTDVKTVSTQQIADEINKRSSRLHAEVLTRQKMMDEIQSGTDSIIGWVSDSWGDKNPDEFISELADIVGVNPDEIRGNTPKEVVQKIIDAYVNGTKAQPDSISYALDKIMEAVGNEEYQNWISDNFDLDGMWQSQFQNAVNAFRNETGSDLPIAITSSDSDKVTIMSAPEARRRYGTMFTSGIYKMKTRPGRQLVVDANGAMWHSIPWSAVTGEEADEQGNTKVTTREVARWAKEHGYDSVRINDVYDNGGKSQEFAGRGDIGIFFNQDDVKSGDAVTYDENGNPIPLDQRFTASPDLRYSAGGEMSAAQMDEAYQTALDSGDTEAAQQMVDEAAKKAGYTIRAYHGTAVPFTVFDRSKLGSATEAATAAVGFFFTDSKEIAEKFSKISTDTIKRAFGVPDETATVMNPRLKISTPYIYESETDDPFSLFSRELFEHAKEYTEGWAYPITTENDFRNAPPARKAEIGRSFARKLESQGYDGIIIRQTTMDGRKPHDFYVVFNPEQVKSADPVTYDDQGNPIPLSQRFNPENEDIRYSAGTSEMSDAEYRQAMIDAGIQTPDAVDSADPFGVSDEEFENRKKAHFHLGEDGRIQFFNRGELDEKTKQILDSLGFEEEDYEDLDTGEKGTIYTIGRNDISFDDLKQFNDYLNGEAEAPAGNNQQAQRPTQEQSAAQREQEMNQALIDAGIMTEQELAEQSNLPGMPGEGSAQRQFGYQTSQTSEALHEGVKQYLYTHSSYVPDSNGAQIDRAIGWVQSKATQDDPDGYYAALDEVSSDTFDYRSADGQARMLTVMSMAALKAETASTPEARRAALNDELRIADAYNKQGTDIGRALQARKIFRLMTPLGRISALKNMADQINNGYERLGVKTRVGLSEWTLEAAAAAKTEEDFKKVQDAASKELAAQMPATWKDRINSLRMLSMLGNPRTHIRNIIGNMLFVPAVGIKNKLSALGELAFVKKGNRTKTLAPMLSKEVRDFARQDARDMQAVLTGTSKYNEQSKIQMERKTFGQGKGILSRTLGKFTQALMDLNSNALEGEDWFFLKGHYRRALGGWMQANGYTAEYLNAHPEVLEKGRAYAVEEAQKATYRDFNEVAKRLNDFTRNPKSRGGKVVAFALNTVLPFKKTPANILRRGIEYSPLGIAMNLVPDIKHLKQYMDYQNGKLSALPENAISPSQFIDHICSGLTGSAIAAMGFLLSGTGVVTCGLDDDDDEFEKLKGAQEYSVKLFGMDVTFTVDWAAPMSMPFFVGAAFREQLEGEGISDIEGAANALFSIAEPLFNLSMLDGVNSVFRTSQSEDVNTLTQLGGKIISNYVTSFIPSALGAVARSYDPLRRKAFVKNGEGSGLGGTVRYGIEQSENKIPGLSQTNIPVRDAFGRAEETGLLERLAENFVLPGYLNQKKDDPVVDELERLYGSVDASLKKSMVPKLPQKKIGNDYNLNAEEYDQITVERGQTAYAMIQQLMDNDYYRQVSDNDKAEMINDVWTFATQTANYNVNQYSNVEAWVTNSRSNPIQGIVNRQKDRVDNELKKGYKEKAIQAVRDNDAESLENCIMKLEELGVKDPEGSVKTAIGNAYKAKYIRAYQDNDQPTMYEIEELLNNTGLGFDDMDKNGNTTYDKWIATMYEQVSEEDEDE